MAWLPERLAQAERKASRELLQKFGAKDADELQAKLAKLTEIERSSMSEIERAKAELEDLKPKAARVAQYETILKARVTAELAELTDEQRSAVETLGGDDPAALMKTIDALKPTWAAQAAAQQAAATPVQQTPAAQTPAAPQAAPAVDTAPPRGSAPADNNTSPPNHKAIWQDLQNKNPFQASAYLRAHQAEIFPSGSD
jgi:transcriptional regulator with XRE-family HTH domain